MFSTLELDLRPGSGLGIFEIGELCAHETSPMVYNESIGTSLWSVLGVLRGMQHFFPQVDVKYDPDSPTTPIILHLRPHLDLLFSGYQQRLHTISVKKLRDQHPPLTLTYKKASLSSNEEVLRRVGVSRMFGPTYPGDDLRYPGVSFSFEEDGRETLKSPAPHADDRQQEVKRIIITQKSADGGQRDALDEVTECPVMVGELSRVVVKVVQFPNLSTRYQRRNAALCQVHVGVILYFYPTGSASIRVLLGSSTAQDLTSDLGPPLRIHYKEDDRMTIHSRSGPAEVDTDGDCRSSASDSKLAYLLTSGVPDFYNYQQHGIDFLISGSTHTVKKIVLHSNVVRVRYLSVSLFLIPPQPGTPLFQRYKRCPWEIEGRPEDDEDGLCV